MIETLTSIHPVLQALLATIFTWLMTALGAAFAAGAMIFVVVEEVIPESQSGGHHDIATTGTMIGFTVMMVLDVALG